MMGLIASKRMPNWPPVRNGRAMRAMRMAKPYRGWERREVGERAGTGDDGKRGLRVARGVRVHRHGLAPAESDDKQEDRAGRVQVGQRVQRHAAAAAGKAIAQEIGD